MEKITRRKFIELGSIASASCWLPRFLVPGSAAGAPDDQPRILVVIQLSGGNDGLNTVIPYTNDLYYRHRPGLALGAKEVIRLNDVTGLHPALEALRPVFDNGELCIVNGVGYPNPDRSHFRSMDIWQSGSGSMEIVQTGWLGRYLDHTCKGGGMPHRALELDDSLSLALKGEEVNGLSLRNPDRMKKALSGSMMEGLSRMYHDGHGDGEVRYLYKILAEAEQSVDYLYRQSKVYKAKMEFPNSELGRDLKLISELINAGTSTRVYYVSLSGFDTHINQKIQQDRGLRIYGEALAAFVRELKAGGRWQQVMVMTFSEFGRRVEQNASAGTDHGKANCLFLAGGSLKTKGIYNALPDLGDLQEGDLRYSVDFRSVYAGLLKGWLGTDPSTILGGDFELFPV